MSGHVEAVLVYHGDGAREDLPVPLGGTEDARALRAIRDALVEGARREALRWKSIDEGVFVLKVAEFERVCRVLDAFFPSEEELQPDLHLVKGNEGTSRPEIGDGGGDP